MPHLSPLIWFSLLLMIWTLIFFLVLKTETQAYTFWSYSLYLSFNFETVKKVFNLWSRGMKVKL